MDKRIVTKQNIMEIIDALFDEEAVYIPREIADISDIQDETKYIFGVAFSECVRKLTKGKNLTQQAVNVIENYLKNIDVSDIENDIECSAETAKEVKIELSLLADENRLRKCFDESFINVIDYSEDDNAFNGALAKIESLPPWERRMIKSDIINMIEENYSIVD